MFVSARKPRGAARRQLAAAINRAPRLYSSNQSIGHVSRPARAGPRRPGRPLSARHGALRVAAPESCAPARTWPGSGRGSGSGSGAATAGGRHFQRQAGLKERKWKGKLALHLHALVEVASSRLQLKVSDRLRRALSRPRAGTIAPATSQLQLLFCASTFHLDWRPPPPLRKGPPPAGGRATRRAAARPTRVGATPSARPFPRRWPGGAGRPLFSARSARPSGG